MPLRVRDVSSDDARREFSRRGTPVHLTRKAFDLLALLIQRRPNPVSKDDIHKHLWPDTFVAEITLQSLVSEIRRALVDDPGHPQFIRTIHGYAFIAPGVDDTPSPREPRRVRGWLIRDAERLQCSTATACLAVATTRSSNCRRPPCRAGTRAFTSPTIPGSKISAARTEHSSAIDR